MSIAVPLAAPTPAMTPLGIAPGGARAHAPHAAGSALRGAAATKHSTGAGVPRGGGRATGGVAEGGRGGRGRGR
eukprot:6761577-Prymnesium_polylepis.1